LSYALVLTDARGNGLGELTGGPGGATARKVRVPLNLNPTVQGVLDAAHPLAQAVADLDQTLLKVYDRTLDDVNPPLRFVGPMATYEKQRQAGGGSLAFTAAGPLWRLAGRLIGRDPRGAVFGNAGAPLDRGEIAGRIVDALNAGDNAGIYTQAGDTGIRRGNIVASSSTFLGPLRYAPADGVLADLAAPLDGYDYVARPVEPVADALGVQIAALDVAPAFGALNDAAAFEFGTGRHNVASWRDAGDAGALCNDAVSLPSGYPDNAIGAVQTFVDAPGITDRGRWERVIADPGGLTDDNLRYKLAAENVRIRKVPRRTITFEPIAEALDALERRVPRPFIDYQVGDVIPFRAMERFPTYAADGQVIGESEVLTVDAYFRIFAVDLDLDDEGNATATLTLTNES
jgi:hypothetical protein